MPPCHTSLWCSRALSCLQLHLKIITLVCVALFLSLVFHLPVVTGEGPEEGGHGWPLLIKIPGVVTNWFLDPNRQTLLAFTERGPTSQIKIQSLIQSYQRLKKLLSCSIQDQLVMNPVIRSTMSDFLWESPGRSCHMQQCFQSRQRVDTCGGKSYSQTFACLIPRPLLASLADLCLSHSQTFACLIPRPLLASFPDLCLPHAQTNPLTRNRVWRTKTGIENCLLYSCAPKACSGACQRQHTCLPQTSSLVVSAVYTTVACGAVQWRVWL